MPRFAEVSHEEWFDAPPATVRAQFADLQHHIRAGVHPKLRFELLSQGQQRTRFVQEVRLLGLRQRDIFEREFDADGTQLDTVVEGFNKGGTVRIRFTPQLDAGRSGTLVEIQVRLPLPPVLGQLLAPLLRWQILREVRVAAAEDKHDIEVRGYPAPAPQPHLDGQPPRARPAANGSPRPARG